MRTRNPEILVEKIIYNSPIEELNLYAKNSLMISQELEENSGIRERKVGWLEKKKGLEEAGRRKKELEE